MASLLDILAWRNISAAVQKVETGIPDRLPSEFTTVKEDVLGDTTTFVTFRGQRQVARRAEYGAPSRARAQRPVGDQTVKCMHFPEHIKIDMELFMRLRNPADLLAQTKAQEIIARAGADLKQLFDNTRIATISTLLATGVAYFDAGGYLLPTSSGNFFTWDWSIGANNKNQLNGILDVTWSNVAANIIQHITNIGVQMRKNTGRILKNAFYGKNVAAYLFNNTTLKAYWQFNTEMYKAFSANPGMIPDGFAGLNWHYMGDTFFDDSSETTQTIFGADTVTFAPEITRNAYTLYEGSIIVPSLYMVGDSLTSVADTMNLVYGMGGYAIPEIDPVGIKGIMFDTFGPAWKNPLDLFIATVAF